MSITDSPRFINTPTLLEEYNADQKGYSDAIDEDTKFELSKEYDRVSGNEEFYQAIFSHVSLPEVSVVSGNEGFLDKVKKGVEVVIQAVKDFFKWLFSFFTGKKEAVNRKTKSLELDIEKNGINTGEIHYPLDYMDIYDKLTKPEASLSWMSSAFHDCGEAMKRVALYVGILQGACKSLTDMSAPTNNGPVQLKETINKIVSLGMGTLSIKGFNVSTPFFASHDFKMDQNGKLHEVPSPPNQAKNPTFRTNQTEVLRLFKEHKALMNNAEDLMEFTVKLEKDFIKALNKELEKTKKADSDKNSHYVSTISDLQTIMRNGMANIKLLELTIFKGLFASLSILNATVNKGKSHAA